jgi:glyoxylase-like metal-dependent hydrolase (beta-lactamase superfamily II)
MRLLNNLYVLTGPAFGTLSHVYAIKYSGGLVFIDAGMKDDSLPQIEKWLTYWELAEEKVSHVLITHGHWDHAGLAAYYREKGALITAHRADREIIETGRPPAEDPMQITWPPCRVDIVLDGNGKFSIEELNFEVIHVPGHTPGSVIYRINLDGKDVWFMGDFIPPEGHPEHNHKHGWTGDVRFSSKEYIESFRKLARMQPDCVLAGHGYIRIDGCEELFKKAYADILLTWPSR